MPPAEVCGWSRYPASDKSAITFRIDAGLSPSRFDRASVRDPTGSPVEINVSTIAVRISRSRFPILGSEGIGCAVYCLSPSRGCRGKKLRPIHAMNYLTEPFYLTILDAKTYLLDPICNPFRILGTTRNPVKQPR